jgi:hypothetical protein
MELRPNMTQAEAVDYLEMLARTVDLDIMPLLHVKGAAPFSIARQVLCYVDHLGALAEGRASTRGMTAYAKNFIANYLAQVDASYTGGGELLYEMYRHGTVHNFAPQRVAKSGVTYKWYFHDGARKERIGSDQVQHLQPIGRPDGSAHLPVSTACLIEDLKTAITLFARDLQHDADGQLLGKWNRHAAFISKPKKLS